MASDKAESRNIAISGMGGFDTHCRTHQTFNGELIMISMAWVVMFSGFKRAISGENFEFWSKYISFNRDYGNFEFNEITSNNTWVWVCTEDNSIFRIHRQQYHSVFMGYQ